MFGPATKKRDGIILPGRSLFAKALGFTEDKFESKSYLWKRGSYIYISFIESREKRQGHFNQLIKNILGSGLGVKVPAPLPPPLSPMLEIVKKKGFKETIEWNPAAKENIDVWVKEDF